MPSTVSTPTRKARKLAAAFLKSGSNRLQKLREELVSEIDFLAHEFGGSIEFPRSAEVPLDAGKTGTWFPIVVIDGEAETFEAIVTKAIVYYKGGVTVHKALDSLPPETLLMLIQAIRDHGKPAKRGS